MSKQRLNIDDALRNEFSQNGKKAPAGLWSSIADHVSLSPDERQLKEKLVFAPLKAPESSWATVKKGIVINTVWDNIEKALDKRKRRILWYRLAGALAILIGLGTLLGTIDLTKNSTIGYSFKSAEKSIINTNRLNYLNKIELSNKKELSHLEELMRNSFVQQEASSFQEPSLENFEQTIKGSTHTTPVITNPKNDQESANWIYTTFDCKIKKLQNTPTMFPLMAKIDIEQPEKPQKHFEIGITGTLNNTWIFDNNVRSGLKSSSLVQNKLSFGYNFGVTGNYFFNNRHGVSLSYDFLSNHSQRYEVFIGGNLSQVQNKIEQHLLQLDYLYLLRKNKRFQPVLRTGTFLAFHRNSQSFENMEIENKIFTDFDLGLHAAYGVRFNIFRFITEIGYQASYGFININRDANKKLNPVNTLSDGVYINLLFPL